MDGVPTAPPNFNVGWLGATGITSTQTILVNIEIGAEGRGGGVGTHCILFILSLVAGTNGGLINDVNSSAVASPCTTSRGREGEYE